MRKNLNLTYRKILQLALQQNSDKNLILRQRWAIAYLGFVKSKKRIINFDESAFKIMDYRRKIWAPKGSSHGIRIPAVSPRISMICAIDNTGRVLMSMT